MKLINRRLTKEGRERLLHTALIILSILGGIAFAFLMNSYPVIIPLLLILTALGLTIHGLYGFYISITEPKE